MRKLINYQPLPLGRLLLGILPLLAVLLVYLFASDARLSLNAADKLLPGFNAMGEAISRMAFSPARAPASICCGAIPPPACCVC